MKINKTSLRYLVCSCAQKNTLFSHWSLNTSQLWNKARDGKDIYTLRIHEKVLFCIACGARTEDWIPQICISGTTDSNLLHLFRLVMDSVGCSHPTKEKLHNTRPPHERCRTRQSPIVKANAHHFQFSGAKLETWRRFKPIPVRNRFLHPPVQAGML